MEDGDDDDRDVAIALHRELNSVSRTKRTRTGAGQAALAAAASPRQAAAPEAADSSDKARRRRLVATLEEWSIAHPGDRMPRREEKQRLAEVSRSDVRTVEYWFWDRNRKRKKQQEAIAESLRELEADLDSDDEREIDKETFVGSGRSGEEYGTSQYEFGGTAQHIVFTNGAHSSDKGAVTSMAWPGLRDFPSPPAQQKLMWEAELVGEYIMLPGSVWKNCAEDSETEQWAADHFDDLFIVTVKEYLPNLDHPPGAWLVQHAGETAFHVQLCDVWPWLEPALRKKMVLLGGPLPTKWCTEGVAPFGSLFRIYASSIGICPDRDKELLWIAQRGFATPIPLDWTETVHTNGVKSYRRKSKQPSGEDDEQWEHPSDREFRGLVRVARRRDNSTPKARAESMREFSAKARGRGSRATNLGRGRGRGRVRGRGRGRVDG